MFKVNKGSGITLIALVITIVIMLILVGVTINAAINSGIISSSKETSKESAMSQEKEHILLAYNAAFVNKPDEEITSADMQVELDTLLGQNKTLVTGSGELKIKFIESQNEYTLSNGQVTKYESIDLTDAIGKTIDGYNNWQLYYYDASNHDIYLISKETTSKIVLNITGYSGTADFADLTNYPAVEMGLLSGLYKDGAVLHSNSTEQMRTVCNILDKRNWQSYATNTGADWAIGAPTLELMCLSINAKYGYAEGTSDWKWPTVTNSGVYNNVTGLFTTTELAQRNSI